MSARLFFLFILWTSFAFSKPNRCLIKVDGKFGYIDTLGNEVIKPRFEWAIQFSEGLAAAKINGKCGYIDTSGNFVIKPKYTYGDGFKDGFAIVWIKSKKGAFYGVIDQAGREVLKTKYENIQYQNEGFIGVVKGDFLAFYDLKKEKFITDFSYERDEVWSFNEGLAMVKVGKNYGFINAQGEIAIQPVYRQIGMQKFSCGLAAVRDNTTSKWGYIDKKGNLVIGYRYSDAGEFREDKAFVYDVYGQPGHFINKQGEKLFDADFTDAWGFSEGLCGVEVDEKHGVIDSLGRWIVQPTYDWIHVFYHDGWISFYKKIDGEVKWGVLNSKGVEIVPPIYSRTLLNDGDCPLIEVYSGDCPNDLNDCALGYVNLEGTLIWKPTK